MVGYLWLGVALCDGTEVGEVWISERKVVRVWLRVQRSGRGTSQASGASREAKKSFSSGAIDVPSRYKVASRGIASSIARNKA